jgi:tetratricopeptide (TPR) repeat protein
MGDLFYYGEALNRIAFNTSLNGNFKQFLVMTHECLEIGRKMGNPKAIGLALLNLGSAEYASGNYVQADKYYAEGQVLLRQMGDLVYLVGLDVEWAVLCIVTGNFDQAQILIDEMTKIVTNINETLSRGSLMLAQSLMASLAEDYATSKRLALEARPMMDINPSLANFNYAAAAVALCGLREYDGALSDIHLLIKEGMNYTSPMMKLFASVLAAPMLAAGGEAEQAVELLSLGDHHFARLAGIMEKWPLITRLRAELKTTLGPKRYAAAWERGGKLDLDEIAQQLLARKTP